MKIMQGEEKKGLVHDSLSLDGEKNFDELRISLPKYTLQPSGLIHIKPPKQYCDSSKLKKLNIESLVGLWLTLCWLFGTVWLLGVIRKWYYEP